MQISQKTELRRLLVPQLRQSLKILALPLLDLKNALQDELDNNPFLEEAQGLNASPGPSYSRGDASRRRLARNLQTPDLDFRIGLITKKVSLQDILLRQLGMFANSDQVFLIGQEIIGNIDENGYLKVLPAEIAAVLGQPVGKVESALKIIQAFEPAGVAARTVSECLLIQLELSGENDPLLKKIIELHLEDVARKNYSQIARALKEPLENIEPLIKRILRLDPKPGRNYSAEETQHIIPDIAIYKKDDDLEIAVNNEDASSICINKTYRDMLKNNEIDPRTREFLSSKLRDAMDLLRAVSKRQETLKKITEALAQVQQEAIMGDFSHLKPITFREIAKKIDMHATTVCRAVMNKYVELPNGNVVALKDFFTSHVHSRQGQSVSSSCVKRMIKELIEREDKKSPLSDQDISARLLQENNLNVSRRTVTKYREDLKVLSSAFRRVR